MITVVLVIHLLLALALVGLVLIQRSEGGALGMGGGGGGGMGGFMTGRDTANLLTRATAFVAAGFFATSLILAILAGQNRESGSLLDQAPAEQTAPAEPPAEPSAPSVPVK
jgi:preprotein translocase subunit SecG